MKRGIFIVSFLIALIFSKGLFSQISPGDLSRVHEHLEGISNCTLCHDLGNKVADEKCLDCHKILKARIDLKAGYHTSEKVVGKSCVKCHSDHHGKGFRIIRFDTTEFNHNLTGFDLEGAHKKKTCSDCHKKQNISDEKIREKDFTYLGLSKECNICHEDYHQKTLSNKCADCHNNEAFKPASKFDHNKAKFTLKGKHKDADCLKCHEVVMKGDKKFQKFSGLLYKNCSNCHKDVHNNKFGTKCSDCHSEESFTKIKNAGSFDHSNTNFKLEGKHQGVACKICHKSKYTNPVKHDLCLDCHKDYHEKQFIIEGKNTDCKECHTVNGFAGSSFTVDRHNNAEFILKGSHLATPCFDCHKKTEKWNFRNIGKRCIDCHDDMHKTYISEKYYPESNCTKCHDENIWNDVKFDHLVTGYKLEGAHAKQSCRACHFKDKIVKKENQRFSKLKEDCLNCHKDNHNKQFETNGKSDCLRCHGFTVWKADKFNHANAAFQLDGKHINVACEKCHKKIEKDNIVFVEYKIKKYKCEDCH